MLKTPVLFIVFNRINTVKRVFDAIKAAKPERLFIAANGPRDDVSGEYEKCIEVQQYILKAINWECNIKTLFRVKIVGCGKAVSEAISWFFSEVSEGIIIEDDCFIPKVFFSTIGRWGSDSPRRQRGNLQKAAVDHGRAGVGVGARRKPRCRIRS